eukprot:s5908_g3.t1
MVALQDDGMEKSPEGGASISHEVTLSSVDSTLDVFFSSSGVLSSLSQGMFRSLRSAVRADTGVKDGATPLPVAAAMSPEGRRL